MFDLSTSWSIDINSSLSLLVEIIRWSSWTSWHEFWIRHHHLVLSVVSTSTLKSFLTGTVELLIIVILGKMIWVNHGQHLWKSLSNSCNSLTWISEWKLAPRLIINTFAVEINNILCAWSAWSSSQWFLGEHGIVFFIVATVLAHEEIIHILQVFLK